MKRKIIKISILILFVLSYILLFIHLFSHQTECSLEENTDLYNKKQLIILKEKKGIVKEIIQKESVFSNTPNILDIKENEYLKKEFQIKKGTNKITAYKKDKEKKDYNKLLKELTEAGYTCTKK